MNGRRQRFLKLTDSPAKSFATTRLLCHDTFVWTKKTLGFPYQQAIEKSTLCSSVNIPGGIWMLGEKNTAGEH
jgi:hypothetical protein